MKMKLWIGFFVVLCATIGTVTASNFFTEEKIFEIRRKIEVLEESERVLQVKIDRSCALLLSIANGMAVISQIVKEKRQTRQNGNERKPFGQISSIKLEREYPYDIRLERVRVLHESEEKALKSVIAKKNDIRRERNFLLDLLTVNRMTQ